MTTLLLSRELSDADGTFGRLILPLPTGTSVWWYTCEDDWKQNAQGESCIRLGLYPLRKTIYQRHGFETYEVGNVEGRSRILIHPGNTEEDSQGCILVGNLQGFQDVKDEDNHGLMTRKRAVLDSRAAFREFMQHMTTVTDPQLRVVGVVG